MSEGILAWRRESVKGDEGKKEPKVPTSNKQLIWSVSLPLRIEMRELPHGTKRVGLIFPHVRSTLFLRQLVRLGRSLICQGSPYCESISKSKAYRNDEIDRKVYKFIFAEKNSIMLFTRSGQLQCSTMSFFHPCKFEISHSSFYRVPIALSKISSFPYSLLNLH